MKILFHYDAGPSLIARLESLKAQGLEVVCCPEGPAQPFQSELKDAEVLWHVLEPLTADILQGAGKLRLIQKIGVGTNTIDLDWARSNGIPVCNMPGTNARATAEMALLLILAASRRLSLMDRTCRKGEWRLPKDVEESLGEIHGRTVGLLGLGQVGRLLAGMLDAMGARVIYHARSEKTDVPYEYVSFAELLKRSDILSLHAALNEQTENIINESALAQMKQGAVLVNTARGALMDELAVYAALLTGKLGAAGLDVFVTEPVQKDNRLLQLDNVVLSPHLGWLTEETLARSIAVASENCRRLQAGEDLLFRVI